MLRTKYVFVALAGVASLASAEERHAHGPHVHGEAQMNVAVIDDRMEIEFLSPAMNIVGFEHEPRTPEQEQALHEALDRLRAGEALFQPSPAADCRLVEVEAFSTLEAHAETEAHAAEGDHDHGHGHEHHAEEGAHHDADSDAAHSEVSARYQFRCEQPSEMNALEVHLFDRFPATRVIDVQLLTATRQRAMELEPGSTVIDF